jgi:hypothetical protein
MAGMCGCRPGRQPAARLHCIRRRRLCGDGRRTPSTKAIASSQGNGREGAPSPGTARRPAALKDGRLSPAIRAQVDRAQLFGANRPELSTSSGAKRPPLIWKKAVCSGAGPNSSPEPRQGSDGRLFARPEQPLIGGKPRDQIEAPAQDRICVPWGRFGTSGHPEDQRREAPWPIVQKQ